MRTKFTIISTVIMLILFSASSEAQFFEKLINKAEKKVEREIENRTEKRINKAIDKTLDKAEEKIDGKDSTDIKQPNTTPRASNNSSTKPEVEANTTNNIIWSKFDFIPGDKVIFEDAPSAREENGEFPSRWDLVKGQVEIANVNGENVLMFIDGNPSIIPLLENSKTDYLPDIFTIEFDFFKPENGNRIFVYLYDDKNQTTNHSDMYMDISSSGVSEKLSDISGKLPNINYKNDHLARWIHVSIAYTKGKLKVYMDDTRVINIPHYPGNPMGLTLQAYWADLGEGKPFYFKNIRIAEGGVKYYDRMMQDGKIIVHGIRFDVGKSSIKPESMGSINEIYSVLNKTPDIKYSIEGHTDSDGPDATNQILSENRAKAVMEQLIMMGISSDRLSYKGFGESKPIDTNDTPEGKAQNRRVEFVKQ